MFSRRQKAKQGLILASKFFWPLDMGGTSHFSSPSYFHRFQSFRRGKRWEKISCRKAAGWMGQVSGCSQGARIFFSAKSR
jgi:hypothetical protein